MQFAFHVWVYFPHLYAYLRRCSLKYLEVDITSHNKFFKTDVFIVRL